MTLSLDDQYRLAVLQQELRFRIRAAIYDHVIDILSTPLVTGGAEQLQMVANVIKRIDYATELITWVVVSRPEIMTVDDVTDALILETVGNTFQLSTFSEIVQVLSGGT